MPNQLSAFKRRQSLADHVVVLEVLSVIAQEDQTTVMDLLRRASRDLIRERTKDPKLAARLRSLAEQLSPRMPTRFDTAAQVARFKRAQREHDALIIELNLVSPAEVQNRNAITSRRRPARLVNFAEAHAELT